MSLGESVYDATSMDLADALSTDSQSNPIAMLVLVLAIALGITYWAYVTGLDAVNAETWYERYQSLAKFFTLIIFADLFWLILIAFIVNLKMDSYVFYIIILLPAAAASWFWMRSRILQASPEFRISSRPISTRARILQEVRRWKTRINHVHATAAQAPPATTARPLKSLLRRAAGLLFTVMMLSSIVVSSYRPFAGKDLYVQFSLISGLSLVFAVTGPLFISWLLFAAFSGRIDSLRRLSRLGTSAGTGTAGGFVVAIGSFYGAVLMNSNGSGSGYSNNVPTGYDTALFVTLPALGAAIGFTLGLFLVVAETASESRYPVYGILCAPVLITLCASLTSLRMSPRRAMRYLIDMLAVNNPRPAPNSWLSMLLAEEDEAVSSFLSAGWFVLIIALISIGYSSALIWRLLSADAIGGRVAELDATRD